MDPLLKLLAGKGGEEVITEKELWKRVRMNIDYVSHELLPRLKEYAFVEDAVLLHGFAHDLLSYADKIMDDAHILYGLRVGEVKRKKE